MLKTTGFLFFVFYFVSLLSAYSQEEGAQGISQPARVEFEATTADSYYEVYPLQDSALFMYAHNYAGFNTKEAFTFSKYDEQLNPIWSGTLPLKDDYTLQ